jgi:3-dehydroquinate synthase
LEERVRLSLATGATEGAEYEIRIGPGLIGSLGAALADECRAHRYAVIADSNVAALYGDAVLEEASSVGSADLFVFPAGEMSKSRESWGELSDRMLYAGLGRDAAVLALGGGVTGDLAGFVAATYLRGLPLVQIPTSLLAMIDSSVGGKTGVDTPAGKNLIGAFHQPELVLADTATLRTLPPAELRAGLAEAVKHGAITDADYFSWMERAGAGLLALESAAVVSLIRRSVEIKARVVEADEREGGLRKTLNFGHTLGHAIEALSGFSLLHGESIAIGMVAEAELGEALGVTEAGTANRLRRLLSTLGLPTEVSPDLSTQGILALTRTDKKARGGMVEYALVERIGVASRGSGGYGIRVREEDAAAAVERCR